MNKNFVFLMSFLVIFISSLIPMSYIIGSYLSFFSLTTIVTALVGKYGSIWSLILFFVTCKKLSFLNLVINRMPLFFVAWSYKTSSMFTSVFMPLLCMFLFIIHPVGLLVWPYAMYWLIPLIVFFSNSQHLFLRALSAVFISHAVGSVIWIYTHQMDATMWITLIPIVFLERVLMAAMIVLSEYCIFKIKDVFTERLTQVFKEIA